MRCLWYLRFRIVETRFRRLKKITGVLHGSMFWGYVASWLNSGRNQLSPWSDLPWQWSITARYSRIMSRPRSFYLCEVFYSFTPRFMYCLMNTVVEKLSMEPGRIIYTSSQVTPVSSAALANRQAHFNLKALTRHNNEISVWCWTKSRPALNGHYISELWPAAARRDQKSDTCTRTLRLKCSSQSWWTFHGILLPTRDTHVTHQTLLNRQAILSV